MEVPEEDMEVQEETVCRTYQLAAHYKRNTGVIGHLNSSVQSKSTR